MTFALKKSDLASENVHITGVLVGVLVGGILLSFYILKYNIIKIYPLLLFPLFLFILMFVLKDYRRGWLLFALVLPLWVLVEIRINFGLFHIGPSAVILTLIGLTFLLYIFLKGKLRFKTIPHFTLIYILFMNYLFSFLYGDPIIGLKIILKLIFGIFVYLIMVLSIQDLELLKRMFRLTFISSSLVIICLMYIYLFVFQHKQLGVYISFATGSNRNQLGFFLALFTPIIFSYTVHNKGFWGVLGSVVFIVASIASLSRGTWVSLGVTILFFLLVTSKRKNIGWVLFLVGISLAVFWSIYSAKYIFTERVQTLLVGQDLGVQHSIEVRKRLLLSGLTGFSAHPILGMGLGNFWRVSTSLGLNPVSHNNYIQVLAEQGLIGFIPFIALLGAILRGAFRQMKKAKRDERWLVEGITASLICSMTYFLFIDAYDTMIVWFIFGSYAVIHKLTEVRKFPSKIVHFRKK